MPEEAPTADELWEARDRDAYDIETNREYVLALEHAEQVIANVLVSIRGDLQNSLDRDSGIRDAARRVVAFVERVVVLDEPTTEEDTDAS